MFMIYLHTKYHMHTSNGLQVVIIKLKDIDDFHMAAILLFYSQQKYYLITLHIFPTLYYHTSLQDQSASTNSLCPF